MADGSERPEFRSSFERWSRRVRSRLALERVLTGAALGLVLGALGAAAAWETRHGTLRPWAAGAGLVGALAGFAFARRRRWNDGEVALYLDAKLGSDEAITTAVELGAAKEPSDNVGTADVGAVVITHARAALGGATADKVRARLWRPWHAAVPVAAAAIGYLSWIPLPPAPAAPPPPPGAERVQLANLDGLEKIIQLAELDARDEAQKQRLQKLADDAKKLREKLKNGVEKREAQADIAKLKDGITAERLSLGEGEQRQGMESALGKMAENPDLKDAAKALGDRDLTQFDDEMEKLANKLEAKDREQAKKTLEEAAEAAKKAGAPDVAKALEEQKKLLEERGKNAEKLKELAKAMGDGLPEGAKEALKDFKGSGSPKDEKKLAEKLDEALGKMTPEQRKKLAENLKKQAGKMAEDGSDMSPPTKQQLKDLGDQLDTPEGQKQLEEQLKKMAEDPGPESGESERQKGLDDAQKGAGEAEGQLGGGVPMPVAGGGDKPGDKSGDKSGDKGNGKSGNGKDEGQAQPGHTEGGGPGDHKGQTGVVDGAGVKAKANAKINKGKPMPGMVMGRTSGKAGETANVQGQGALGNVAPEEVGGVERSDIPEEYREQVGRYFQPK